MFLQKGEEEVLFPFVVLVDIGEVVEETAQLHHVGGCLAVADLPNLLLHTAVALYLLLYGAVLLLKRIHRVSGRNGCYPLQVDAAVEHRRMQIAEVEDLLLGEGVAVDQLLLHLHHLVVGDAFQYLYQLLAQHVGVLSFVQPEKEMTQQLLALRGIIDKFAHSYFVIDWFIPLP